VSVNGIATALSVSLVTGVIGNAGDTVNSVVVAQGDIIGVVATKAASVGSGALRVVVTMEAL
jgi:hypothetical protein